MEAAIEAGAQDVESDLVKPDVYEDAPGHTIWTAFEDLNEVAEAMSQSLGDPKSTAIVWKPQSEVPLSGDAVGTLFKLLDAPANAGMGLTESFAMTPAAAVSGFYFAHPESHYFPVSKIGEDQMRDWAARCGMSEQEARRWLAPLL